MSLREFIGSKVFLKLLLKAIGVIFAVIFITLFFLRLYTHHGQSKPVPSLMGLTSNEAIKKASEYSFRVEIKDSVHVVKSKPGTIVDQVPEPGLKVKQNRTIYLTINAISPELVRAPKLKDISFRQAMVLIENAGLVAGDISYEQSEFKDLVINARFEGTEVFPGEKIPRGSRIDLIIGNGAGAEIMNEDSTATSYF